MTSTLNRYSSGAGGLWMGSEKVDCMEIVVLSGAKKVDIALVADT